MTLGQNVPKLDALHLMDGIEGLRSLPKHSVDMLLTDLPYGTTRNFWDVPLPLPELWEAVRWAVKPNGAILFFSQCQPCAAEKVREHSGVLSEVPGVPSAIHLWGTVPQDQSPQRVQRKLRQV